MTLNYEIVTSKLEDVYNRTMELFARFYDRGFKDLGNSDTANTKKIT